jgi:hypothetical protein
MAIGIYVVVLLVAQLTAFSARGENQCVAGPTTTTQSGNVTQSLSAPAQTNSLKDPPTLCYALPNAESTFHLIADGLAAAALIELAYTLFTPEPDEALNPIMLGLSAALLLQVARVGSFKVEEAGAALLYVTALASLFGLRLFLKWSEYKSSERNGHSEEDSRSPVRSRPSIWLWIAAMAFLAVVWLVPHLLPWWDAQ